MMMSQETRVKYYLSFLLLSVVGHFIIIYLLISLTIKSC